jgi:hypothetical protein
MRIHCNEICKLNDTTDVKFLNYEGNELDMHTISAILNNFGSCKFSFYFSIIGHIFMVS